ncbi:MAG: AbrB/MazE/SpoVT family DNA-binding domain-containing protein [archaeon]
MFESICTVGERGQITLPKVIRDIGKIRGKDKVIVKIENNKVIVEKYLGKKDLEKRMLEGYRKMAKQNAKENNEWKAVDKETDAMLDDY